MKVRPEADYVIGCGEKVYEIPSEGQPESTEQFQRILECFRQSDRDIYQQRIIGSSEIQASLQKSSDEDYVLNLFRFAEEEYEKEFSPEDFILLVLDRLIEEGSEWSSGRRMNVRQFIISISSQCLGRRVSFDSLLRNSVLSQEYQNFVGEIDEGVALLSKDIYLQRQEIVPEFYR